MPGELMSELVKAMRRGDPQLFPPGFLPVPDPSRNSIGAELDHVRAVNMWQSRTDRVISLIERYWEWSIAPHWNSIRSSLEEETLFRGRTLAVEGPEAMLGELGGRVMWSQPTLTAPYHQDISQSTAGAQLLLVPTVFAGGVRLFVKDGSTMAMSYQARATGHFHVLTGCGRGRKAEDRLALLLGKGRAQVVRALELPRTTTALAETLGFAKSTVSQHLAVLTSAGIVWKQRVGGQVFYRLDHTGLALLRQLGL
jgi:DNA-binding transcriptional ArsR family regulator